MRKSFNTKFITKRMLDKETKNDEVIGVSMNMGGCSEHEHGIHSIERAFRIIKYYDKVEGRMIVPYEYTWSEEQKCLTNPNRFKPRFGIEAHIIHACPDSMKIKRCMIDKKKYNFLLGMKEENYPYYTKRPRELFFARYTKEDNITSAWSSNSFGLLFTDDVKEEIRKIYKSFQKHDIVIYYNYNFGDYRHQGVSIMIASEIPDRIKEEQYQTEKKSYEILQGSFHTKGYQMFVEENKHTNFNVLPMLVQEGYMYYICLPRRNIEKWVTEREMEERFWTRYKLIMP